MLLLSIGVVIVKRKPMKDKSNILKIGIDLDDTITYCKSFFSTMTNAMQDIVEIHIITNRE